MDVKVILEENKTEFEKQIKEYLEKGYILKNSNFNIYNYYEKDRLENFKKQITFKLDEVMKNINKIVFYALMIKE